MGAGQSAQSKKPTVLEPTKINHPRFDEFANSYNSHEPWFQVKIPIQSQTVYNDWEKALQHAPHDHDIFLMPHELHLHQHGFCGSSHYVNAFFDKFPFILSDEIKSRNQVGVKGNFSESQIWYLLYTLVSAGNDFHVRGLKVGDIRPQNIFINHEGRVKIPTYLTWPDQKINYQKTFYQNQVTYLAPEQINDLKLIKSSSSCNSSLAQSFSIGLTCLDAALLKNNKELYLKNYCFDYNGLAINLKQLKNKHYSSNLVKIVTDLCNPQPQNRVSCSQIFKLLEPYQNQINGFRPFQFKQNIANRTSTIVQKTQSIGSNHSQIREPPVRMTVDNPQATSNVRTYKTSTNQFFLSSPKNNNSASKQTDISTPYRSSYRNEEIIKASRTPVDKQYSNYYERYSRQPQSNVPQSLYTRQRQSASQTMSKIDQQIQWSKKMFPK